MKEAWDSIPEDLIAKSFKKCGISNAVDGTEDDMLYEDLVASSTENRDINTIASCLFITGNEDEDEHVITGINEDKLNDHYDMPLMTQYLTNN